MGSEEPGIKSSGHGSVPEKRDRKRGKKKWEKGGVLRCGLLLQLSI